MTIYPRPIQLAYAGASLAGADIYMNFCAVFVSILFAASAFASPGLLLASVAALENILIAEIYFLARAFAFVDFVFRSAIISILVILAGLIVCTYVAGIVPIILPASISVAICLLVSALSVVLALMAT